MLIARISRITIHKRAAVSFSNFIVYRLHDLSQPVTVAGSVGWPRIAIVKNDRLKPSPAQISLLIAYLTWFDQWERGGSLLCMLRLYWLRRLACAGQGRG
jgi:hypothetical protein